MRLVSSMTRAMLAGEISLISSGELQMDTSGEFDNLWSMLAGESEIHTAILLCLYIMSWLVRIVSDTVGIPTAGSILAGSVIYIPQFVVLIHSIISRKGEKDFPFASTICQTILD
jgi:hypothetical protein